MPMLTELLTNTNSRVTALENNDLADKTGVARIVKNYAGVKVTACLNIRKRVNLTPKSTLYPGGDVHDQIDFGG